MDQYAPLIVGSTTLDENIINGTCVRKIGGVPVYAGLTWKKLGCDPVIITNIAETDQTLFQLFKSHDIHLYSGITLKTTFFINEYQQDQRIQQMLFAASPIHRGQIEKIGLDLKHFHLGPLHPDDLSSDCYQQNFKSKFVTLDIQGLTRSVENGTVITKISPLIEDALNVADVIKADQSELNSTLKYFDLSVKELIKQFRLKEIIETDAEAGGHVHTADETVSYLSQPKTRIKDTTGAGDVFFAAYLHSRHYKNKSIPASCNAAATIAARHIEGEWLNPVSLILE